MFDKKGATYLRMGLKDVVPCNTHSRAVRHALTLVIHLARSELWEKSINEERLSTNDLSQRKGGDIRSQNITNGKPPGEGETHLTLSNLDSMCCASIFKVDRWAANKADLLLTRSIFSIAFNTSIRDIRDTMWSGS